MPKASWAFATGLACLMFSNAYAQVGAPPASINPGAIQQNIQRQQEQLQQENQVPKLQGPAVVGPKREKNPLLTPGGSKFLLRKVTFDPSKFLSPKQLDELAKKYVGKQVDIAALQQLVADVNALYEQKGIVTGIATLPEQNAADGVVHIQLTEGRLEKTTIQGNVQTSQNYILHRVDEPVGEVLDVPKLNNDVTWFNRTNDVQVKALLQPGSSFGLTDLNFAVTEPPRNTLQLFYDNEGVQTTGEDEFGTFYKLHGLFGVDDRLTFYGVKSAGNINGNVAYNIPINDWGGRLGGSFTDGDIKIVEGPFVPLDVTGRSTQSAINFSQPMVATENWLMLANGAMTYGTTLSDFTGVPVTQDFYWKDTGGFALTYSTTNYSLTASPAFNSIAWHDQILGVNRDFETLTATANVQIRLPQRFSISFMGSGQYTGVHLLPGDQLFTIGGPTTVRGYPTNAVQGDSGYYYNIEFHHDWADVLKGFDTYGFVDSGAVYSTSPAEIDLTSVGCGLSWTPVPAFRFEASYGVPTRLAVPGQPHYEAYGRVIFQPLLLLEHPV
jgi:hemolysin activation/secretion protein